MKTKDIVCVHAHINGSFVPAGVLEYYSAENESMCKFKYFSSYLNNTYSFAIDPVQLPLNDSVYSTPRDSEYFNGIRDSCPDSWGDHLLEIATAKAGISMKEVDYILYAGPDRTGALGFSSAPSTPPFSETPLGTRGRRLAEKSFCWKTSRSPLTALPATRIFPRPGASSSSAAPRSEEHGQKLRAGSMASPISPSSSILATPGMRAGRRPPAWRLPPTAALPQRELSAYPC